MIKLLVRAEAASENAIKALVNVGALYVNETGIHASDPGAYPKKGSIPADRKSEQG